MNEFSLIIKILNPHLFLVFYQKGTMWHLAFMMLLLLFCQKSEGSHFFVSFTYRGVTR